jgi:hypothetical protein
MKLYPLALPALFVCVATSLPAASFGQAPVSDSFTGTPGAINNTGGGTGFAGNYSGTGTVFSPGLTYPGLQTTGNQFHTAGNNNGVFRTLGSPIDTDAGTIWVSFLAAGASELPPDYAGLSFFSGGQATEELFLGKPFQSPNYGFDVSGVAGGALNSPTAPVRDSTASLLVYRLTFTPAGETIDFFANPTPGSTAPATPTLTFAIPEGAFADTLTTIRLQSGEGAGGAAPFSFDEIRGGTTFAQVAPVPEPAALGLLGIIGLVALRRRRA